MSSSQDDYNRWQEILFGNDTARSKKPAPTRFPSIHPDSLAVKEHNELADAKATMIVNFGQSGRVAQILNGAETMKDMIIKVATYYNEQISLKNGEHEWKGAKRYF